MNFLRYSRITRKFTIHPWDQRFGYGSLQADQRGCNHETTGYLRESVCTGICNHGRRGTDRGCAFYFGRSSAGYASLEDLKKKVTAFAENLMKLRNAPVVEEFYSGPVLFEDGASSSIFVNNLLNQSGLFAYRKPIGQAGGRTLEGRIGRKIIDNRLTVKNYTSWRNTMEPHC